MVFLPQLGQYLSAANDQIGSFTYKCAVGNDTVGGDKPIAEDALFQLASQTKLLTSIAALQIVERGLFELDEDVSKILPELCEQPILKGHDENDKPILEKRKNTITFRDECDLCNGCKTSQC